MYLPGDVSTSVTYGHFFLDAEVPRTIGFAVASRKITVTAWFLSNIIVNEVCDHEEKLLLFM
jgi:hypothetical protein